MALDNVKKHKLYLHPRYESELVLAQTAASGDKNAQRDLINAVVDQVRRTASYLANPERDADDLAQVALIQILNSVKAFRGECSLRYWADRITVRTAMKQARKRQRRDKLWGTSNFNHLPPARGLEECLAQDQIRLRIAGHLKKLSTDRRTAIVLHHIQGYGISEIAEMTGTPVNTVRDRLRVGRKQLKKRILADRSLKEWLGVGKI
ncbi:MAG: RNA polymerase sigma factor [Myxococcota bacterium]|nr:RNA polymerase sigma factor [Myxococcota bacterium]